MPRYSILQIYILLLLLLNVANKQHRYKQDKQLGDCRRYMLWNVGRYQSKIHRGKMTSALSIINAQVHFMSPGFN